MAMVAGVLLAAGAGTRMGTPKALLLGPDGTAWLARGVRLLAGAGCSPTFAVLGAASEAALRLLPGEAVPVIAADWASGMAASLRAGLDAAESAGADAALVTLVDVPSLPPAALTRVLEGAGRDSLRQARYHGRPGHPVLIGAEHFPALVDSLSGDAGARRYLLANDAEPVECGDLGDGEDVDGPG